MVHIVLFEPEIPPNTANIIRTCFAIGAKLHIIKPISFSLDPKYLSRPADRQTFKWHWTWSS
nr:TrmH family RNA methyltransferase [Mycoplasmopsis bovis]